MRNLCNIDVVRPSAGTVSSEVVANFARRHGEAVGSRVLDAPNLVELAVHGPVTLAQKTVREENWDMEGILGNLAFYAGVQTIARRMEHAA